MIGGRESEEMGRGEGTAALQSLFERITAMI